MTGVISKYRGSIMGVAMLWIMLFHYGPVGLPLIDRITAIGYGGVDVFLFCSGFGLYYSLAGKHKSKRDFYRKRLVRILPEFWIVLLFKYVFAGDFSLNSIGVLLVKASTLGYWIPGLPYELWYVSAILFFYAVFPFCYSGIEKRGIRNAVLYISVGFALVFIYALAMIAVFDNENRGGLIILTIARIPVFFLGSIAAYMAIEKVEINMNRAKKFMILCLGAAAVCILLLFQNHLDDYLWTCSLDFMPMFIIAPVMCLVLSWIFERLPHCVSGAFAKVGSISFELYLVHEWIFSMFERWPMSAGLRVANLLVLLLMSTIAAVILKAVNTHIISRFIT